jgi:hypothetical protein
VIGKDFGVTTEIQTGPNGNLFVVSLSNGAIYEIKSKPGLLFTATLNGSQETPPNSSTAVGRAALVLSPDEKSARLSLVFNGLSSTQTDAHVHGPAPPGVSASPVVPLPLGQLNDLAITLSASQVQDLKNGLLYVNVHSANFPAGEIRGQFVSSLSATSVQFSATSQVVHESAGSVLVGITRAGNLTNAVTIDYATSNGSAQAPGDFVNSSGSVQFAPGESVKFVSVPIVDDALVEGVETLKLTLSSPTSGAVEGSPFTTTISILDDDKPLIVTEQNTPRAAAVDSVWFLRDPFSLGSQQNFSADHHTRIVLFATGVDLLPGENALTGQNASVLVVQLDDNQNHIYPLVVEDVRKVPNFDWLSQIVVRLPDTIDTEGDFRISLTLRGVTGNKPVVTIFR